MIEVLSPFPEFAVPRVWDWIESFRGKVCDDYSPTTREAFVQITLGQLQGGLRSWAIYKDGDLGGMVTYQPWNPRVGTMHTLFKRSFWGRETTETALRQIGNDLFSSGVEKVTAYFFEDNHALRGLLRNFGAKREGWFESQTVRGGVPVSMEAVAIFKDRFYASSSRHSVDYRRTGSSQFGDRSHEEQPTADISAELLPGAAGGAGHPGEVDSVGAIEPDQPRPDEDSGGRPGQREQR